MRIKIAKTNTGYSTSFLPSRLFKSKQELIRAAKIKLADLPQEGWPSLLWEIKNKISSIKGDSEYVCGKINETIDQLQDTLKYEFDPKEPLDPAKYHEMISQLEQVCQEATNVFKSHSYGLKFSRERKQ